MESSIKAQMLEEWREQMEELRQMHVGSDEYRVAVDGITKLSDRIIEVEKQESEQSFRDKAHEDEQMSKERQARMEKNDRIFNAVIKVVEVLGTMGITVWAFVASMNFEKFNTLTTEGGRASLRALLRFFRK